MSTIENVCVYGNDGWVEMGTNVASDDPLPVAYHYSE